MRSFEGWLFVLLVCFTHLTSFSLDCIFEFSTSASHWFMSDRSNWPVWWIFSFIFKLNAFVLNELWIVVIWYGVSFFCTFPTLHALNKQPLTYCIDSATNRLDLDVYLKFFCSLKSQHCCWLWWLFTSKLTSSINETMIRPLKQSTDDLSLLFKTKNK